MAEHAPLRDSPPSRLAFKLALSMATSLFALAALEIAARIADPEIPMALVPSTGKCFQRSYQLGYELIPDCRGKVRNHSGSINSSGLRGREVRDDDSVRLPAIGDSCTFGWLVAESDTYPRQLKELLNQRASGPGYQVLNAGVPGYTSYQGRLFLREKGIQLRPAVVIIGFGFNDALYSGDIETVIERQRRALLIGRADEALLGHSVFYRWLRWVGAPTANTSSPRVDVFNYRRNSEDMIRFAHAKGVEVVLVDFLPPSTIHPEYKQAIATLAEEFDVPLIEYPGPTLDVVHPTVEGYGWLARQLAKTLAEQKYLD